MKREVCAVILAFSFIFISVPIFAQTSLKIVVIDTDKAFKESIWGKKAIEGLEKEAEEWQKKGEKLDKEISEIEEQLAKQRSFLDDDNEEQRLKDEIDGKRMEGQILVQQGNAKISETRQELLEPILEEIKNLIKKLSMQENYDIVLEKQLFVLYLNPELDITNQIIVMLDNAYKDRIADRAKESEPASE